MHNLQPRVKTIFGCGHFAAIATIVLACNDKKIILNWTLNGVDMTSQTYTYSIWAHMSTGGTPPYQVPHMGPYKIIILRQYLLHLMTNLF